jgi:hypothetical protein
MHRIAVGCNPHFNEALDEDNVPLLNCGPLNKECALCGARFWPRETNTSGEYTLCCHRGQDRVPPIRLPPPMIATLLDRSSNESKRFFRLARDLNTHMSFASSLLSSYTFSNTGIQTLRVNGGIRHNMGTIVAPANAQPRCSRPFKDGQGRSQMTTPLVYEFRYWSDTRTCRWTPVLRMCQVPHPYSIFLPYSML